MTESEVTMFGLSTPTLIKVSKTYETTCPKCHTRGSLTAKLSGKASQPNQIDWNVYCSYCAYHQRWTQWTASE